MKLYSISLAVFTFSLVYIKHWSIDNHWTVCSTAMRLVCSTCWVYILRQSIRFQGHYYSNISKHITNGNTHTHSARFNANHINAVNRLRKKKELWNLITKEKYELCCDWLSRPSKTHAQNTCAFNKLTMIFSSFRAEH